MCVSSFHGVVFEMKNTKQLIEMYALNGPTARLLCMLRGQFLSAANQAFGARCLDQTYVYMLCIHTCVCILVNYNTHAASSAAHMTPYGIVKCVYLACRKNSDKRVNARSISPDNVPSRYFYLVSPSWTMAEKALKTGAALLSAAHALAAVCMRTLIRRECCSPN